MTRRLGRWLFAAPPLALLLGLFTACGPPTSGKSAGALWTEQCARCHGEDGRGDPRQLALAPTLDLTRSVMVKRRARGLIYQRIQQGYGAMPGFAHRLEQGDVELLIGFVLNFGETGGR